MPIEMIEPKCGGYYEAVARLQTALYYSLGIPEDIISSYEFSNEHLNTWIRLVAHPVWVRVCCPNRKVVHMAEYAKKRRTKKKNFNRAQRILYKQIKKGGIL